MIERTAACSCGAVRLVCRGEPVRVSICHCRACQRRTGSVFGVTARFPAECVDGPHGETRTFERVGDEGGRARFSFCPVCATSICWTADRIPGFVSVAVGTFADPGFPPPTVSVYEERRHPWTARPDHPLERFD